MFSHFVLLLYRFVLFVSLILFMCCDNFAFLFRFRMEEATTKNDILESMLDGWPISISIRLKCIYVRGRSIFSSLVNGLRY